jgi:hypothetical protein
MAGGCGASLRVGCQASKCFTSQLLVDCAACSLTLLLAAHFQPQIPHWQAHNVECSVPLNALALAVI